MSYVLPLTLHLLERSNMSKEYTIFKAGSVITNNDPHSSTQFAIAKGEDQMQVSDGYHTMDELYDHRISIYIALCKKVQSIYKTIESFKGDVSRYPFVWRSKRHSDGEICFGTGTQYVLGIGEEKGKQITYHVPIERWEETDFAITLDQAPEWDGHSSSDVIDRLKEI